MRRVSIIAAVTAMLGISAFGYCYYSAQSQGWSVQKRLLGKVIARNSGVESMKYSFDVMQRWEYNLSDDNIRYLAALCANLGKTIRFRDLYKKGYCVAAATDDPNAHTQETIELKNGRMVIIRSR